VSAETLPSIFPKLPASCAVTSLPSWTYCCPNVEHWLEIPIELDRVSISTTKTAAQHANAAMICHACEIPGPAMGIRYRARATPAAAVSTATLTVQHRCACLTSPACLLR